ncbi:hypothetical protein KIS1582_4336 [Cytobacillus firmus]|uniref:Uncharacterized protein n=1 Tax=Cytobacillus firmus TaxID=1399 RepID=A0A800MSY0_CYTFI|nr:hypothetical protein KIS1582_4336 [Cytobacillus firmus]
MEPAFAKGFSVHMVPENEEDIFTEVAEETSESAQGHLQ